MTNNAVVKNKRIVITAYGGPEVLRVVEEDVPQPRSGEVRVKVLAAGVAFADVLFRRGLLRGVQSLPFTPGFDIVGVVDGSAQGIRHFSRARRIFSRVSRAKSFL